MADLISDDTFFDNCAIAAMQANISGNNFVSSDYKGIAICAYRQAYAMLEERRRNRGIAND